MFGELIERAKAGIVTLMKKWYILLVLLMVTAFGTGCVTGPFSTDSELYYAPYITLPEGSSSFIAINWITPDEVAGEISWGLSPKRMIITQTTEESRYHQVYLVALKPNTLYYYTVDGGKTVHRFNTAKVSEDIVSLAIIGGGRGVDTGGEESEGISKSVKFTHPDVVVQLDTFTNYSLFLRPRERTFQTFTNYSMEVPFIPAPSVEDYSGSHADFLSVLFPGHYSPYGDSFTEYGNLVRLVVVNPANHTHEHIDWLRAALSEPFAGPTLVFFNQNPFSAVQASTSSTKNASATAFWSQLMGMFYDLGISHLFWGETQGLRYYSFSFAGNNLHFFGTGGNGSIVERSGTEEVVDDFGLLYALESPHYMMVYVSHQTLRVEVYLANGEQLYDKGEPVQWVFPIGNS